MNLASKKGILWLIINIELFILNIKLIILDFFYSSIIFVFFYLSNRMFFLFILVKLIFFLLLIFYLFNLLRIIKMPHFHRLITLQISLFFIIIKISYINLGFCCHITPITNLLYFFNLSHFLLLCLFLKRIF